MKNMEYFESGLLNVFGWGGFILYLFYYDGKFCIKIYEDI